MPVLVDTILLIYFFYLSKQAPHGLDVTWDYVKTISKDGVKIHLNLDVQVSIPQEYVSVFGVAFGAEKPMVQFSEDYLRPRTSAKAVEVMNMFDAEPFLRNRFEAQGKLEEKLALTLAEVFVNLEHILIQDPSGDEVTRLLAIFAARVEAKESKATVDEQKLLADQEKLLRESEAERDMAYKIKSAAGLKAVIASQTDAIKPLLAMFNSPEVVASKSLQKKIGHSILLMLLQPIVGEQAGALATAFSFADSDQKWVSEVAVGAQNGGDIASMLMGALGKMMTQKPDALPSAVRAVLEPVIK